MTNSHLAATLLDQVVESTDDRMVRGEFATEGDRFFIVAGRHEAAIWVANVEGNAP